MEAIKPKAPAPPTWLEELPVLARPAAVLLACLVGAIVVLVLARWLHTNADTELAQATHLRAESSARLHNVGIEKQELGEFAPSFARLQAGGMIGDERRLAWIETIKASQDRRKLFSANYEIAPQQPVGGHLALPLGDFHLRASRMRLELGMAHELDLFNMLGDLRAAGPYTVEECQMKRLDVPQDAVGVARLSANCTLIWLTLGAPPQPLDAPLDKGWP